MQSALVLALFVLPASTLAASSDAWLRGSARTRHLTAAGLPDPKCHAGVLSLGAGPTACCAGYCGECSDYDTCKSVRGQNSTEACCKTQVLAKQCGKGAPANACLKTCSEGVPPCIMDIEVPVPVESARHAGQDCNEAVEDWRNAAAAATEAAAAAAPPKK